MKKIQNNVIASVAKQSLALLTVTSLAFGLAACGDDSSSSSGVGPEENETVETTIKAVVFGSDYTTGELRWIDKDNKISKKSLDFFSDSKVAANAGDLYVMERMGADNITKIDPEKLESDGKKAVIWQVSLDDDANPTDMVFDGEKAWVALQNADSLIQISTKDGKIAKSIKTGKFAYEGEKSPYVTDLELADGKLYALFQRYTKDENWNMTYPKGLLAIYDAKSGDLKDTIQLKAQNPSAMTYFDGAIYVASMGEYNEFYGTDADDKRGIEKVNLKDKKSEMLVSGEKLGGGVYTFAAEDGVVYVGAYKGSGDVPLMKVALKDKKVETVKGIADAEGSVAVRDGEVFVGDRTMGSEKVIQVKDGKAKDLESPKGALAPFSIVLF